MGSASGFLPLRGRILCAPDTALGDRDVKLHGYVRFFRRVKRNRVVDGAMLVMGVALRIGRGKAAVTVLHKCFQQRLVQLHQITIMRFCQYGTVKIQIILRQQSPVMGIERGFKAVEQTFEPMNSICTDIACAKLCCKGLDAAANIQQIRNLIRMDFKPGAWRRQILLTGRRG